MGTPKQLVVEGASPSSFRDQRCGQPVVVASVVVASHSVCPCDENMQARALMLYIFLLLLLSLRPLQSQYRVKGSFLALNHQYSLEFPTSLNLVYKDGKKTNSI